MRKKPVPIIALDRLFQRLPLSGVIFLVVGFIGGYYYYDSLLPTVLSSDTQKPALTVCFSPEGNCEKLVIKTVDSAKSEILVMAYSFTSAPITQALIEAKGRGVSVRVLFDKGQLKEKYSRIQDLKRAGISTYTDRIEGLAHNKVIIVDGKALLTGSYNWTNAANKKNAENLLLIHDPALASIYRNNWIKRFNENQR